MSKISASLATYNEENTLEDCLKSLKDWVDEIVIVDGSSRDKTVKIAKRFNARVTIFDNPKIFHINKQKAIDAAKYEWILQIDADERVDSSLRDEIERVIRRNPKENGFWIPRKNFFLGRFLHKGGQYPDYTLRLYRKGKGRLPCKSVHEQAVVEGAVGYLNNPLIHIADQSFSRYLMRFNRYTSLIAQELADKQVGFGFVHFMDYFLLKPIHWFILTFVRHKGFLDGFPGFVFSLFSSLRFPVSYIKYWEKIHENSDR